VNVRLRLTLIQRVVHELCSHEITLSGVSKQIVDLECDLLPDESTFFRFAPEFAT
jgi:hypothetical protein